MPASNTTMIHKLQQALNNTFDTRLLYNKTQFYSEKQDRPVTMYIIKRAIWDDKKGKNTNVELFKTTSQIQVVLFLRDMWYELNGWEVPTDNDAWNKVKATYKQSHS